MKLVILILNRIEYLEDLLTGFLEIGVEGATVIDSVGMGRILSHDVPIFAGLRDAFPGSSPSNKMIFSFVRQEIIDDMVTVIEEICGCLDDPGVGLMVTLPIDSVIGLRHYD